MYFIIMLFIVQLMRDPVLVMCGKWDFTANGTWDFTIDKRQMGRCVNMDASFASYSAFSEHVKSEFGVAREVEPMFTYWVPSTMAVVDAVRSPPIAFTTDERFSNYKAIRSVGGTFLLSLERYTFPKV